MKNNHIYKSEFYCVECGRQGIPIIRKPGMQRKSEHLKKLYCVHCRKETNHAEIKSNGTYLYSDFKEEFDLGRFVDGKRVPLQDLFPCDQENCPYNKRGKCWNANHSYKCEKRGL